MVTVLLALPFVRRILRGAAG